MTSRPVAHRRFPALRPASLSTAGLEYPHKIILPLLLLGRMPHRIVIRIASQLPPQNDGVKIPLIDILMNKGRPFDDRDRSPRQSHLFGELLLNNFGAQLPDFIPLIGHQCKGKGLRRF